MSNNPLAPDYLGLISEVQKLLTAGEAERYADNCEAPRRDRVWCEAR